jgi:hypothetical protein
MQQNFAVHFISDERRLLDRFSYRKAFYEIGCLVEDRTVGAVEHHLDSVLLEPPCRAHP